MLIFQIMILHSEGSDTRGSWVQGQHELHSETLRENNQNFHSEIYSRSLKDMLTFI